MSYTLQWGQVTPYIPYLLGGALVTLHLAFLGFVGGFVIATQADMAQALLHTQPGWYALGAVFVLEALAGYSLSKILEFDC